MEKEVWCLRGQQLALTDLAIWKYHAEGASIVGWSIPDNGQYVVFMRVNSLKTTALLH